MAIQCYYSLMLVTILLIVIAVLLLIISFAVSPAATSILINGGVRALFLVVVVAILVGTFLALGVDGLTYWGTIVGLIWMLYSVAVLTYQSIGTTDARHKLLSDNNPVAIALWSVGAFALAGACIYVLLAALL